MTLESNQLELDLAHQASFSLRDAAGLEVICHQGSLWITLDNDSRDIVLEPGARFSTTEHRHALVYALKDSHVAVMPRVTGQARNPVGSPSSLAARAMPAQRLCAV